MMFYRLVFSFERIPNKKVVDTKICFRNNWIEFLKESKMHTLELTVTKYIGKTVRINFIVKFIWSLITEIIIKRKGYRRRVSEISRYAGGGCWERMVLGVMSMRSCAPINHQQRIWAYTYHRSRPGMDKIWIKVKTLNKSRCIPNNLPKIYQKFTKNAHSTMAVRNWILLNFFSNEFWWEL